VLLGDAVCIRFVPYAGPWLMRAMLGVPRAGSGGLLPRARAGGVGRMWPVVVGIPSWLPGHWGINSVGSIQGEGHDPRDHTHLLPTASVAGNHSRTRSQPPPPPRQLVAGEVLLFWVKLSAVYLV
jgi:hypothetical protein